MGKKKNKFNKKPSRSVVADQVEQLAVGNEDEGVIASGTMTTALAGAGAQTVGSVVDPRYLLIRKEVKQVLLTILILLLILIGTYFLEAKTGILDKMGAWIYKISNIQTQ